MEQQSVFIVTSHGTFNDPWGMAFEPGTGRLFMTEKPGAMKFYVPETGLVGTVTGIPENIAVTNQGGLADIAFAPDYATSGMIYLSWAETVGENKRGVAGRGKLVCESANACHIENLTRIWEQTPATRKGGQLSLRFAFSPDAEYLFIASGDRMEPPLAQDLSNNLGSVVRLLPDGTPAPGNPFADKGSPSDQVWSYGHRNLLGFGFDLDGNLWNVEHGPAGGDELNLVKPGHNYGWPVRSYGNEYSGKEIPDHTEDDGFTKPAIYWTPVIAPGGMIVYSGAMWPEWRNQILIANLRTQSISRIITNASANSAKEAARYQFPNRMRGLVQGPDGAIWAIEDGEEARLLRLVPDENRRGR